MSNRYKILFSVATIIATLFAGALGSAYYHIYVTRIEANLGRPYCVIDFSIKNENGFYRTFQFIKQGVQKGCFACPYFTDNGNKPPSFLDAINH